MSQPTTGPLDLPLDAHLHTDLSPDADVPIDLHAAAARERGVAELAITDHLDFDPRAPAYAFADYERRLHVVREAAERWDGQPRILFGVEITYRRRDEAAIREHLAGHPYDYVIGSVHIGPDSPFRNREEAGAWCTGKTPREASAFYWDEVEAAIRSELFDTIGHLDFVKRYLVGHLGPFDYAEHADIYDRLLRPLAESGAALEVNSSGLRQSPGETYPPPAAVERYRALGGRQVTAGTDAHRLADFGFGLAEAYRIVEAASFETLARGRTSRPAELPPGRIRPASGAARPR